MQNSRPEYELVAINHGVDDLELGIWQLPAPATPKLARRQKVAALRGRNLALAESSFLKILKHAGIRLSLLPGQSRKFSLEEETALALGLLCRTLAPMRNVERMRQILSAIEHMPQQETAYWLGMAMHRKRPGRVLAALRLLLSE